ncbi:MAG: hypothetical protein M1840_002819 [Geoglossum simile]|nr:MAG: hypothetical protein M1840_002819 [Geoglossum simile]
MCTWKEPRSAVIRDTMYLDGGLLSFLRGMEDGTYDEVDVDQGSRQYLYYINFSQPFNTSQNASEVIRYIVKPPNNLAPTFYDGAMFANDYELMLYGGLLPLTDSASALDARRVISYEKYQHFSAHRPNWAEGPYNFDLPPNMTRYITQGASVSVPSENLAFYFSGMRGSDWGEIKKSVLTSGNFSADTLISVDMAMMRSEKWDNKTLPSQIPGRANAELVWIPVTTQGVLLAIGGVLNPDDEHLPTDQQYVQSGIVSPTYMQDIAIYDIYNQKWYTQKASGDTPGALTQFCSVVASAKDGSSHSVYIYGGYDAQKDPTYSDDVYVLSVPSFIWTKVYSGKQEHARVRHKCSRPYPDQMFVVGGNNLAAMDKPTNCLDGGMIEIFNLNNLTWQTQYDPDIWSEYEIPSAVLKNIGGNADGGATTVSPSNWDDSALPSLFSAKYSGSITTHYPYPTAPTSPHPEKPAPTSHSKGSIPRWVAPFLGVVLGLVAISAIVTCFLLRRHPRSERGTSGSQSGFQRNRLLSWLASTTGTTKPSADVTSDGLSVSASGPFTPITEEENPVNRMVMNEVLSNPIYELDAPRDPIEIGATDTTQSTQRPAMTQITPSHHRVSSPTISRRAIPSTYSAVSATYTGHAHTISDVSASTDPNIPSSPASPENEHSINTIAVGSPVSPPVGVIEDPIAGAAQGRSTDRGPGFPAQRNQRDSPTRKNRESMFGERFD